MVWIVEWTGRSRSDKSWIPAIDFVSNWPASRSGPFRGSRETPFGREIAIGALGDDY